jgi:microcystin-dependent protein
VPKGEQGPPGERGAPGTSGVPIGSIVVFVGEPANGIPDGYLLCDGSPYSPKEEKYKELYQKLGNRFGGDPNVSFKVPDVRGRFVLGSGDGKGLQERNFGKEGGSETVKLTPDNLPAHVHHIDLTTDKDGIHSHTIDAGPGAEVSNGDGRVAVGSEGRHRNWPVWNISASGAHQHHLAGDTKPNDTKELPFEIMPPYLSLYFLNKYH